MLHLYVIQRAPKISEGMDIACSQEYHTLETLKRRTPPFCPCLIVFLAGDQTCLLASCHSEGSPLCLSLALNLGTASLEVILPRTSALHGGIAQQELLQGCQVAFCGGLFSLLTIQAAL